MSLRTALLGTLAFALAFGSAFAFARAGGEPRVAQASAAALVHRGVAVIPTLSRPGAPPSPRRSAAIAVARSSRSPGGGATPSQERRARSAAAPTAAPRPRPTRPKRAPRSSGRRARPAARRGHPAPDAGRADPVSSPTRRTRPRKKKRPKTVAPRTDTHYDHDAQEA